MSINIISELTEVENVIAISEKHFVHYYNGMIGVEKMVSIHDFTLIKEATCNPLTGNDRIAILQRFTCNVVSNFHVLISFCAIDTYTGDILAYDASFLRIIRYNPHTGNITHLLPFKGLVQGMAVDYIGNNLITSCEEKRTIEVTSMTTWKKTVFYFKDIPKSVAVVPELG